jgi:hypothetical protein
MPDRRRSERRVFDTHLDDLQSEQEAESRTLARLQSDAARVDAFLALRMEHASLLGTLMRRIQEARASAAQQRAMLKELRQELATLRGKKPK